MGTVNVLEPRAERRVRVVVNVTTDKCYENREREWPTARTSRWAATTPTRSSKGCAELVTDAYRRSFFSDAAARGRLGRAPAT